MALHPAPTVENHLGLIMQPITSTSVGHTAQVTCAIFNSTALSAQSIINLWQTAWNARIAPVLDSNSTSQKPTIILGNGSNTPGLAVATGAAAAGGIAAAFPPAVVSLLVKKNSAFAGKKNRGRMYIPFAVAEPDVGPDGLIGGAVLATLQTHFNSLLSDNVAVAIQPVISNKTLVTDPVTGKKYVTAVTAGPNVTSFQCETHVATQRRRMPRQ